MQTWVRVFIGGQIVLGATDIMIAVPYCRVFLNRQSAAAHTLVFKEIERIVLMDTGMSLKWRHLHASSLDDHTGILQWAGDQHAGQAKGKPAAIPILLEPHYRIQV